MMFDLLLKNGEIVFPGDGVRRGDIGIVAGKIAAILAPNSQSQAKRVIDCTDRFVMPGAIDPHTHIGFGAKEADFGTESLTAAMGGVTSLMTFWRAEDLAQATPNWIAEGQSRSAIDFGLHFGVTSRRHVEELPALATQFGVTSIKVYLMYKGATGAAKGFTEVDDALLFRALQTGAKVKGGVVGVHCENTEVIPVFREPLKATGRQDLAVWHEQSPGFLETENVFRVAYFGEKAECPVNIVHMSAGESLEVVRRLRKPNRAPIHIETCVHYLTLNSDMPLGAVGKVNPPLRPQSDVDALWEGVASGEISTIGSDHVPRKVATKGSDIWSATAGFPAIAQILPALISEGYHKRGVAIETLAAATSRNVADLYSLKGKGRIAVGYDADLAIIDPEGETVVRAADYPSHSDYSPFEGMRLRAAVTHTIRRGQLLLEDGQLAEGIAGSGQYLRRNP